MAIITANSTKPTTTNPPPPKSAVLAVSTAAKPDPYVVVAMEVTSDVDDHLICSGPVALVSIVVNILIHSYAWLWMFCYHVDQRPVLVRMAIYSLCSYSLWLVLMRLLQCCRIERPPLDVFASRPVAEIDDNASVARSLASLFHLAVGVAIVGVFSYVMVVYPLLLAESYSDGYIALPVLWLAVHAPMFVVNLRELFVGSGHYQRACDHLNVMLEVRTLMDRKDAEKGDSVVLQVV